MRHARWHPDGMSGRHHPTAAARIDRQQPLHRAEQLPERVAMAARHTHCPRSTLHGKQDRPIIGRRSRR